MAQLSRPYQILLGVVLVLGLVWAVALRGHASNPSEPVPSSPPTPAPTSKPATHAVAKAKAAGAPTPIYHGAAPGVEGLTRAIAKAHGAVAASQRNAQQLKRKSSEVSTEPQTSKTSLANAAATDDATRAAAAQKLVVAAALAHAAAVRAHNRAHAVKPHGGRTVAEIAVESELAHGKTVMLLFWNPKATVDREVQGQASSLAGGSKGAVTMHTALAHQVSIFGKITEVVRVYQTPTILIVNRHGVVSTLTGLTDVFSLEQAVREARLAGH